MKRQRQTSPRVAKAIDRSQNPKAMKFPVITPKTDNQKHYVDCLDNDTMIVSAGPAGTGKSLLAIYAAAKALYYGKKVKIVLIRAYQPLANRSIGFLPGTSEEKLMPFYQQMLDYLEDFLGKEQVAIAIKRKAIEICSLETIRGRSWDDSYIVVDEAQNLFVEEIQALVTRLGKNTQMALLGDDSGIQTDITDKTSGLSYLLGIVDKYDIPEVGTVKFDYDDILRSDITKDFVIAFDKEAQLAKKKLRTGTKKEA